MPNLISYRDTAARVVLEEGIYYRYIFDEYKAEYDHLMQSGLYIALQTKGLIIAHEELNQAERAKLEEESITQTYCPPLTTSEALVSNLIVSMTFLVEVSITLIEASS